MSKQIIFGDQARTALKRGIDKAADAVKITIGPKGRNVIVDRGFGAPMITNDGVSIAKEINLEDKVENLGAEIIKDVASKTDEEAGDGTTTAVVLAQAIIREGLKKTTLGTNAMGLRLGIEAATAAAVETLRTMAKPIKGKQEIVQVATIAAENEEFGRIIAETIDQVGKDGVVAVEESQSFGVEAELTEGLEFDKGYISPYMITDTERMEAEYRDALVLLCDKKISTVKEILPVLEKMAQSGKKELVIIAEDVDGEALATLVVNKIRGVFHTLAVKAPGYGDRKKEMLEDIAVLTGGKVISEEAGMKLEAVDLNALGQARKVIATKDKTVIIGGKGKKAEIETRINQLRAQAEKSTSQYDKEKLLERLGKLAGGAAIIKVGAATESEIKYKKLKVEDAVKATKAAIEEGIVPGGGAALIKAAQKVRLKNLKPPAPEIADEFKVGVEILLRALEAPLKQIAVNAGQDDGAVIVDKIKSGPGTVGYDARANQIVKDMFETGVIDPVKVTRTGLQRAASAAAILLTTEVAVTDEPKEEKEQNHSPGAPEMGY